MVDLDGACLSTSNRRRVEGDRGVNRQYDVGDVGQVWHCPIRPVVRIKPVVGHTGACPGHAIQSCDVGAAVHRGRQDVVGLVVTVKLDTGDNHLLVLTSVLVGKSTTDGVHREADTLAINHVRKHRTGEVHAGSGVAVVHLVLGQDTIEREHARRDLGRGRCLIHDGVVAPIGATVGGRQIHRLCYGFAARSEHDVL